MPGKAIGLDIGGANLKAATAGGHTLTRPFELWKHPEHLADELRSLVRRLPSNGPVAVTMTGELCDCFESKRDGVRHILASVREAFETGHIVAWSTTGRFLTLAEAADSPVAVAAANWHALATFGCRLASGCPALLVDVGSTTTDIIPICNGGHVSQGRTDPERMRSSELVYTGARRTPVCALLGAAVAAEFFATTLDVYLCLGMIAEDESDCGTANGRPASASHAHARLARMVGGDREITPVSETHRLAQQAFEAQRSLIASAIGKVTGRMPAPPGRLILAGSGEFLAREAVAFAFAAEKQPELISFQQQFGPEVSTAACAYAVAVLATERLG